MKWKLTGRYLLSVVLVVVLIIFINLILGIAILVAQAAFDVPIFQNRETSPEQFTRKFHQEIITKNHDVTITEKGQKELAKKKAWIQILDENSKEVYSFGVPANVKKKYTPAEIVQMYKYKEVDENTVVYVGEKKGNGRQFSYLIGIENRSLNRYIISYDNRDIFIVAKVGMVILLIDILIALLVGYLFSKRLTQPLHTLIDGIKKLANHQFNYHTESRGLYKNVFDNLNHLSDQLKASERERKKLDSMREEWIANISHDIKTPLSSIQGYAEMIKDPDYDFTLDEIKEYAGIIEAKSLYIKEVMEDLNLTTRLKNKELSLNKKAVNIVTLLRKIVIDLLNNPKYADRNIQFHVNQETIMLEIDEILFRRAINNLIYNAIVHNDHDVKIIVSVEQDEYTHIVIKDNGKGIEKEELERIFDRYYRGTNTGAAHRGSGLGMAIANDIIKAHDGRIIIHSEVGSGTTIDIQI
ncbi:HAMP domain-containing sensor histidine kinase [Siminovitchia fortis]|uniref:histidine kinase n=1 Tax=Siminovitchia fortis TaxID=254758 RepID=A0A451GCP5_9BACI|nr:HAMP domain-containing sensor histidine kinase [Siminovitchia fortis]RWR13155.1 HAMP domain-containing histidine kinase [Siminovitchia fortis]WHY82062.1 HAMP domain-containing sensor histidine kinase [Siminovitchia fortis]